jgi:nicotinamidase-related amidase
VRASTENKYQPKRQFDYSQLISVFNRIFLYIKKLSDLGYKEAALFYENRSERAIIIIDMINEFMHRDGRRYAPVTSDIIPYVQGELEYFRERMRPVIFCNSIVKDEKSSLEENQFNMKVIQVLSPRNGEKCINKSKHNAFFETDLAVILKELKVHKLTITGVFSHTSILTTAASAIELGFSVVVPETCVNANNPEDHAAALRLINRWLSEL